MNICFYYIYITKYQNRAPVRSDDEEQPNILSAQKAKMALH